MQAMLLAAGRGERMGVLTDECPKPLLSVGGRSLLEWHLRSLARAGFRDVVINLAWKGAMIPATFGTGENFGLQIRYSDEGAEALETAGGIRQALPLLGREPFLVVNGDVWCDFDFARLPKLDEQALAALMLVSNPSHHPQGDFVLQSIQGAAVGNITDEVTDESAGTSAALETAKRHTYAGIGVFRPEFFAAVPPGRVPLAPWLHRAAALGRLRGFLYHGNWVDVGTPERLRALDERLAAGAVG
jgi:MurNAc alpha-1-phosphate uridylyltransferase